MAAVHFTTIPFEPKRSITHKVIFGGGGEEGKGEIRPCNSNFAYPRFEVYETFLCVVMSNFLVFMR